MYILSNYPSPEAIANMNSRSYDNLRKVSRGKFSLDKFAKLKSLAKNTVGVFDKCYRIELDTILYLYAHIDSKINELETEIAVIIEALNPPTLSVKGIGAVSAAVIVSEFGDFARFETPDKMLSFAGLEPGYFQSGTVEHNGRMVKHGSSPLRCVIMNCSRAIVLHNEIFAAYFRKKMDEGKPYNVVISHVAKKLIRLIFALETKGEIYNEDKLR